MVQAFLIYNGLGIFLLRLIVGIIFLAHGERKLAHLKKTSEWFEKEGFRPGKIIGPLVTFTEIIAGGLILVGLFTHIAAAALIIVMLGALFYNIKAKQGFFKNIELDLILIAALLVLATSGNGILALNDFFSVVL